MAGNSRQPLGRPRRTARLVRVAYSTRKRPLRIENRHRKMKLRALSDFAVDPNLPAVNFDEMLRNRQAQSCAAGFSRTRCVHAIKPLKDPRLIRLRNPDT